MHESDAVELTPLNAARLLREAQELDRINSTTAHEDALRAQLVVQMMDRSPSRNAEREIRRKPPRVPRPQRNSPYQARKIGMSHRQERMRVNSEVGLALAGQLVAVRQRRIRDDAGPAVVFDLVIQVGKGKKHANELRARVEEAYRQILFSLSDTGDSNK